MNSKNPVDSKKTYATPVLQMYGSIAVLTRSSKPVGMGDGAPAGNAKT
jgi:hypothetical protein